MAKYKVEDYATDEMYTIMDETELRNLYETEINHDVADCGYPDFESWLADMKRCDLITEI